MDRIPTLTGLASTRPVKAAATSVIFHPVRAGEAAALAPQEAIPSVAPRDGRSRDRRAFARATAILDDLALLQSGLLAGEADSVVLHRLAGAEPLAADDPRLADLLAHASLRAQVELARRESGP